MFLSLNKRSNKKAFIISLSLKLIEDVCRTVLAHTAQLKVLVKKLPRKEKYFTIFLNHLRYPADWTGLGVSRAAGKVEELSVVKDHVQTVVGVGVIAGPPIVPVVHRHLPVRGELCPGLPLLAVHEASRDHLLRTDWRGEAKYSRGHVLLFSLLHHRGNFSDSVAELDRLREAGLSVEGHDVVIVLLSPADFLLVCRQPRGARDVDDCGVPADEVTRPSSLTLSPGRELRWCQDSVPHLNICDCSVKAVAELLCVHKEHFIYWRISQHFLRRVSDNFIIDKYFQVCHLVVDNPAQRVPEAGAKVPVSICNVDGENVEEYLLNIPVTTDSVFPSATFLICRHANLPGDNLNHTVLAD